MLTCYTNEVVWLAKNFGEVLSLERVDSTHNYRVSIRTVCVKEKYVRLPICGHGFTVEDACCDYLRLARGYILIHGVTDKEIEVV